MADLIVISVLYLMNFGHLFFGRRGVLSLALKNNYEPSAV